MVIDYARQWNRLVGIISCRHHRVAAEPDMARMQNSFIGDLPPDVMQSP